MEAKNHTKILVIALLLQCVCAFIFDEIDDSNDKTVNLLNYKYPPTCLRNDTISSYITKFRTKYEKIEDVNDDDIFQFKHHNFNDTTALICESKRNLASQITDLIHLIGNECVKNDKLRKKFILNTLLILEFKLDFVCSISENMFTTIYINHVAICINEKMGLLERCRENSFKVLFFDKIPGKVTWLQLINGGICNFDYGAMVKCAEQPLESCDGATSALGYLLDVIKRNSLCFKKKNISDIIENSEDDTNIVDK